MSLNDQRGFYCTQIGIALVLGNRHGYKDLGYFLESSHYPTNICVAFLCVGIDISAVPLVHYLSNHKQGMSAIKFEAAQIHFLSDVFVAVAVVVA